MTEWLRNGARVYSKGKGRSYNCTNIATAKDLHTILTNYENTTTLTQNIHEQYDTIIRHMLQLQMSIKILEHEITTLQEVIQCLKSQ